jgi:hypothetical protein
MLVFLIMLSMLKDSLGCAWQLLDLPSTEAKLLVPDRAI